MKAQYILCFAFIVGSTQAQTIRVGAKHFTEGYIVSEIIARLLEQDGLQVERRYNLGGTMVCFEALRNGAIDIYPEYSGTVAAEILQINRSASPIELAPLLQQQYALSITSSFGFNNTYALVMSSALAEQLQVAAISDLARHPALRAGISYEFLKRQDGWEALAKAYSLPQSPVGLEHGLAYQSLAQGHIDLTDAYSTDGEIPSMGLRLLKDDRNFFPTYEAVALYRTSWHTRIAPVLEKLEGAISEAEMQRMNAEVVIEKKSIEAVAADFLARKGFASGLVATSIWQDLFTKTAQHLALVAAGLLLSILFALPLGVWLYWHGRLAQPMLYFTGLLQTIPSIALLAMLIPWMGIGVLPAICALFLYGLLPLLRNTLTGLRAVDPLLKNVSMGMGLTRAQQLKWVEWPLALPTVLAGIRTAAVINVGTATLAAFIGAGGLGEYIVTGLALNNTSLILRGALPAALLAILVELLFELIENRFTPSHLRAIKKS